MRQIIALVCFASILFQSLAFAADKEPVRAGILNCNTVLVRAGETDALSTIFSENTPEAFEAALQTAQTNHTIDSLRGGQFFVRGVSVRVKDQIRADHYAVLAKYGLTRKDVKVRVLSVPQAILEKRAMQSLQDLFERMRYYLPSVERDFEVPLKKAVFVGLISNTLIEASNVIYLSKSLAPLDATLTITNHIVFLTTLVVFNRMMVNWLLRQPKSKRQIYWKQMAISAPFITNYNIVGHFSEILNFASGPQSIGAKTYEAGIQAFTFLVTQGLMMHLLNIYYSKVQTQGVQNWSIFQTDPQRNKDSQVVANLVSIVPLSLNALILANAAIAPPLVSFGPAELKAAHLYLIALTLVGMYFMRPKFLDPLLPAYRSLAERVTQTKSTVVNHPAYLSIADKAARVKNKIFQPKEEISSPLE